MASFDLNQRHYHCFLLNTNKRASLGRQGWGGGGGATLTTEHTCPYSRQQHQGSALYWVSEGSASALPRVPSCIYNFLFFLLSCGSLYCGRHMRRGPLSALGAPGCEQLRGAPGSHTLVCESAPRGALHRLLNNLRTPVSSPVQRGCSLLSRGFRG